MSTNTSPRELWDDLGDRLSRASESPDARTGASVGLTALGFLVFVGILWPAPVPILFLGMVLGSISALIALGIVLIYRANRIINFAQGDLGAVAAVLAASLIVGPKWPFFLAVGVAFLSSLVLGAVVEVLIIRRFAKSPRLIFTVATIGLQQVFVFGQLALPQAFGYDTAPQPPVPFDFTFRWDFVVFRGGHLLILIVVPIVMLGLAAFFRYTRVGIAVRASAESADRAALLGVPVKRVQTLVWVIAAGLSALAVLLRLPIQGVSIGAALGPALLLRALAAAVLGRMEMPRTFAFALILGMMEQAVLFVTGRTLIVDAVMFFLIIGGLVLQRRGLVSRAEDVGASSWTAIREVRPIPKELRSEPLIRGVLIGGAVLAAVALLILPLAMGPSDVNLLGVGLIFAMVILSLALLTGWAGQISLGHLAFTAFGAAVAGTLAQQGRHFFVCLLVAGLVGALVAVAIGIPALRIQGLFLAVTTLAFALATGVYFLNEEFFPWLVPDSSVRVLRPVLFGKFDLETEHTYYYVVLVLFGLTVASLRSLRNSRSGRVLVATRDNVRAAQAFGISPVRARLSAFALSGFIAAMAGGVYFFHQHGISTTLLETPRNLLVFSMAIIGGLGSVPGALLGSGYLMLLQNSSLLGSSQSQFLASGVGLLLILMVFPAGLSGILYDIRDALLRRYAKSRGLIVPSLLADVRVEDAEAPPDFDDIHVESLPTIEHEVVR
ncbi:MAG: branched-chain amino acid transport system permease protein livM [Actinomycetota bacterium]